MPKIHRYLALLRGINVGGNNIIKMAALRACFEAMGFTDVSTYIQSGNVMFSASATEVTALESTVQQILSRQFQYQACVVILALETLQQIVEQAPGIFGTDPDQYRYDVIFLKQPLTAKKALKIVEIKEGVDSVAAGRHALYFSRLISKATQSRLSKIILKPEYKFMTIRNWNTTTKLLALTLRAFDTA